MRNHFSINTRTLWNRYDIHMAIMSKNTWSINIKRYWRRIPTKIGVACRFLNIIDSSKMSVSQNLDLFNTNNPAILTNFVNDAYDLI